MEEPTCATCKFSSLGIIECTCGEGQDEPVLKCMRYPPTVFFYYHGEDEMGLGQANPEATNLCGEYQPAEKTTRVVGTLRKVQNYGTRISARIGSYLRTVRWSNPDSQSRDQANPPTQDA